MAESLLFSIAEGGLGKIASPALQEAVAIYSVEGQIHQLRETLTAIKAVLLDAEVQKAKNGRLQVWLDRLQHVFYDAKDVLDELECEALRKQVISHYRGIKGKEKQPRPDLLEIGNDIVKKSQGVPLLVKTLGSLYSKDDDRHWKHIRDSETWELVEAKKDIMPVLKLSYDHLPSHLKRCFAAFSLLSRGIEIKGTVLARFWMALGLIGSNREKLALEYFGLEYVKELWKRSLIQEVQEYGSILAFKVHDLVHSLATSVAQNDCSIVGLDTVEISEGVRCISFSNTSSKGVSNFD
ncbi:putative disease resistance protein RGA4 [Rhodamnia argentea]|uniref:Disease resistance protein RGA4 n=1 Tax=Rhodamnia argentea TaxID=178133 RepID=A0ABM3HPP7_9MYRT|nr:putative disease resistance protein RGA4 [Rhodamnia argentea]